MGRALSVLVSSAFSFCLAPSLVHANSRPVLAKEQILRIGNGVEPKEIDPAIATGAPEGHIIEALFEGLTSIGPFSPDPIPGVAESWTVSPDGLKYIFKIRKNSKWSDGKALTAEDFVYSWTRVLEPKTASEYAYQLYYIKNGEAYNKGTIKDPKQLGVKALDPYTLEVQLEHPTAYFLYLTAFQTLYPTPKHVLDKFPDLKWTRKENIVSNGAFKLAEEHLHQYLKLVPNEHYWQRDVVKLKEIYIYPVENKYTEEKTFVAGQLHITSNVPAMRIPYYEGLPKNDPKVYNPYKAEPLYGLYYYRFNTTRKPLNDPRVRRALAISIDRKEIVDKIIKGGKIPASSFVPPFGNYDFKGNLPLQVTDEVLQEAKKLLAQAGYPEGKNMPKFDILYDTDEDNKRIAVAIQQMWNKNLGIKVGLFNQEWKVYLESLRKLDYDIGRSRWLGDYPDPNTFLDLQVTNGGNNDTGWSNKSYDEYIRKASLTVDPKERFSLLKNAEELLMKELPVVPIFFYTNTRLVTKTVKIFDPKTNELKDWKSDVMERLYFKYYALSEK